MDGRTKYQHDYHHKALPRKFDIKKLTPKQLKSLDVVELPIGPKGKLVEAAQNTKLFDKLNAPHLVKDTRYGGGSRSKPRSKKQALTPQQEAAERRRKAKEAKEQLERRSQIWARRFRMQCLARQVPAGHPVVLTTLPLLLSWCYHSPGA